MWITRLSIATLFTKQKKATIPQTNIKWLKWKVMWYKKMRTDTFTELIWGFNNFCAREEWLFIMSAARTSSKSETKASAWAAQTAKSIWCVVLKAVNVGPAIRTLCALVYQAIFSWRKQTASVCPEMGAAAAHLPAARSVSSLNKYRSFVATSGQVRGVRCRFQHPFNYHHVLDIWNRTKPTRVRL